MTTENQQLVNWSVVLTNVSGFLIGSSVLGIFSGVVYMVFTFPQSQAMILRNQEAARMDLQRMGVRLDKLEASDRRYEQELLKLRLSR